jgi:O-antigen/teichoic acid export membrane protein
MTIENNKRIAKNTLLLYFRTILTMLVALFTVRIVLDVLGIIDYGIFNVVGGIVTMLGFLSGTMAGASQRFLAFEIGRNDKVRLKKMFSVTLTIYVFIAFVVLIVAETFGLWFVNHKMVIPPDRIEAARWVYHFAVFSFVMTIITIPYQSVIIAREKMNIYALIGIIEVVAKLLIVYLLVLISFDKLKLYAILAFSTTTIITLIYRIYCKKNFEEATFKLSKDWSIFREISSYAGWNMIGSIANIFRTNGVNILLNLFYGPIVNAARGISFQITSAMNNLILNFYMAVRPQITKTYASGDNKYFIKLVFQSSKFSFFLLLLLTMPLIIETHFILELWLRKIPPNVILFTRLMIISLLIETINNQLIAALQASGKIKHYQITISLMLLLILPVSYLLFKFKAPPESTFYVSIGVVLLYFFPQILIVKKVIQFSVKSYFSQVIIPIITVTIISYILPVMIHLSMEYGMFRFFVVSLSGLLFSSVTIYTFGISQNERNMIKSYINKKIKTRSNNN